MDSIFALYSHSWPDVLIRVGLASLFGFIIGFDRSYKNKPIDFRVYMLVALTTCLVAMTGEELYARYQSEESVLRLDLFRIFEGVLVGIGFLGAGAIIKSRDQHVVKGTATAASIWSAGAIGLMLGFGSYGLALVGFIAIIVILVIFGFLRKPLFGERETYEE